MIGADSQQQMLYLTSWFWPDSFCTQSQLLMRPFPEAQTNLLDRICEENQMT